MKTAEEILQYHYIHDRGLENPNYVVNAMQDYARQVADAVKSEAVGWVIPSTPVTIVKRDIKEIDISKFLI